MALVIPISASNLVTIYEPSLLAILIAIYMTYLNQIYTSLYLPVFIQTSQPTVLPVVRTIYLLNAQPLFMSTVSPLVLPSLLLLLIHSYATSHSISFPSPLLTVGLFSFPWPHRRL
jgi:hypothetical protein